MRHRISLVVLALVALAASLLASCGGDDEGYPSFEMMYQVSGPGTNQVWVLEYESADEWKKTLLNDFNDHSNEGKAARWNGDRIAWRESSEGPFVEDQSPDPPDQSLFPEHWFEYDAPTPLFAEIDDELDGVRTFRHEYPTGSEGELGVEILAVDEETGIPLRHMNHVPGWGLSQFTALSATVVQGDDRKEIVRSDDPRCDPHLCVSDHPIAGGRTSGADVVAWGFGLGYPIILRSSDPQYDRVEQHLRPDGSVRLRIERDASQPLAEYVLVQEREGEWPTLHHWRLAVDDQSLDRDLESDFMLEIYREYVAPHIRPEQ